MSNYFGTYHELVLKRILVGAYDLYSHQREALLAIYQKACRREMDAPMREAALILAGVGTGKTLIQAIAPFLLAPWMLGRKALFLSDNCTPHSPRLLQIFVATSFSIVNLITAGVRPLDRRTTRYLPGASPRKKRPSVPEGASHKSTRSRKSQSCLHQYRIYDFV
ncbi:MAG: hypothetical protein AB4426_16085 [Xenococcaceae cyanobacterium]